MVIVIAIMNARRENSKLKMVTVIAISCEYGYSGNHMYFGNAIQFSLAPISPT